MRSFIASTALLIAGMLAAVALIAHILSGTVLQPDRPGAVIAASLDDRERRAQLVETLAGVSGQSSATRDISVALDDPQVREELRDLRLDEGVVDVTALREEMSTQLTERGQSRAAAGVIRGDPRIALPGDYAEKYDAASTMASFIATTGTIAVLALVWLAMLASTDRPHTARVVGIMALVIVGGALLLFLTVPWLLAKSPDSGWLLVGADALRSAGKDLVGPLLVIGGAGVIFLIGGMVWRRVGAARA